MQDAPDKETLLLGVARFLDRELRPQIKDPRLAFRVLVAAHLALTAAMESSDEEADVDAELSRLGRLLGHTGPAGSLRAKKATARALEAELVEKIQDPGTGPGELRAIAASLQETLRAKLRVNNPRFDTRPDIE